MKEHEADQQERIEIDQLLHDKKYLQAALLAFENNYTQLFINTVNKLFTSLDPDAEVGEVSFEDGKLMISEA